MDGNQNISERPLSTREISLQEKIVRLENQLQGYKSQIDILDNQRQKLEERALKMEVVLTKTNEELLEAKKEMLDKELAEIPLSGKLKSVTLQAEEYKRLFMAESSKNRYGIERLEALISNLDVKMAHENTPNRFAGFKEIISVIQEGFQAQIKMVLDKLSEAEHKLCGSSPVQQEKAKSHLKGTKKQDEDCVLVYEAHASTADRDKANRLFLPPNFFNYTKHEACPGCIGCRGISPLPFAFGLPSSAASNKTSTVSPLPVTLGAPFFAVKLSEAEHKLCGLSPVQQEKAKSPLKGTKKQDEDCVFVYEARASIADRDKANRLFLPLNFFNYTKHEACPGCVGCRSISPLPDYSEKVAKVEQLAFKFKTQDELLLFKEKFEECQKMPKKDDKIQWITADTSDSDLMAQFGPKPGSWSCFVCLVSNKEDTTVCVACGAAKLSKETTIPKAPPKTGFQLPKESTTSSAPQAMLSGLQGNASSGSLFVFKKSDAGSLSSCPFEKSSDCMAQFAPKPSWWSCSICLVSNEERTAVCVACGSRSSSLFALNVSSPTTTAVTSTASPLPFTFGALSSAAGNETSAASPPPFAFGLPSSATSNKTSAASPPPFAFGLPSSANSNKTSAETPLPFKFGLPSSAASNKTSAESPLPFAFGLPSSAARNKTSAESPLSFTFGLPSSAASNKTSAESPLPFTFVGPSSAADNKTPTASPPPFAFGLPSSANSNKTSAESPLPFTFGGPSSAAGNKTSTASPPPFAFGLPSSANSNKTSAESPLPFTFGGPSSAAGNKTSTASPLPFSFGLASSAASKKTSAALPLPFTFGGLSSAAGNKTCTSSPVRDDDNLHFKPVIPLPDEIQVVTGEEGLEVLFSERAKLYRFDVDSGQWKERGVGEVKLLRHPNCDQGSVLMRREQIKKLCANHRITAGMELKRNVGSDRTWVWYTSADYAEGEARPEKLAIKFKTSEIAVEFKQVFDDLKEPSSSEPLPKVATTLERKEAGCKLIPLLEKVECHTGEEGQEVLFCERCKLFRYDSDTLQWKERGVGNIKILHNPCSGRYRVLMRREHVFKLCANHAISTDMELKQFSNSDRAWLWTTLADFSEEVTAAETLAARFRTNKVASQFKETFYKALQTIASKLRKNPEF